MISDYSQYSHSEDKNYFSDSPIPRNNVDKKPLNNSGKLLLNLCIEASLKILNGRTVGDLQGKYTCKIYNGCSLVDYTLALTNLMQGIHVGSFSTKELTTISDHCLINYCLLTCFQDKITKDKLNPSQENLFGMRSQ